MKGLPQLPTSLVGSYAQPNWLIDKARLGQRLPPRVILDELWKISTNDLEEAQNDATIIALDDQRRAGVDIVTDGEMRRESYSNRFANALDGIDIDHPGEAIDRTGKAVPVPRVSGAIRRRESVEAQYIAFLKAHTDKPIKITLPGPFTMSQQAQNDYYPDEGSLAMAYAEVRPCCMFVSVMVNTLQISRKAMPFSMNWMPAMLMKFLLSVHSRG